MAAMWSTAETMGYEDEDYEDWPMYCNDEHEWSWHSWDEISPEWSWEACQHSIEETEEEHYICGVRMEEPEEQGEIEELLIDSGSQSTACMVSFAPEYGVDDTEKVKLWDIQNNKIGSYGKKVVDVNFVDGMGVKAIPGRLRMDVSDVGRNVAAMGRLLRAGFDLHFTDK